ncbi:Uncharacterised protein [Bordetella pertussis]|nr:Uncharacterised protein [Bordetella pertussis]CPM42715.1 Uncharacterised protein [Bordetella pertussis]CPN94101.1 Uncharacterised protein [Bordetella pertussis]CPQ80691.1 Uncharacterised protein [Bordetella pertussis]
MLATSFRRTCEPSLLTLSRMRPKASGVCSRDGPITVALSCWPRTAGWPPSCPDETCTFCSRIAVVTSEAVRPKLTSFSGLIHMRMAYGAPNSWKLPTPGVRLIGSWMYEAT